MRFDHLTPSERSALMSRIRGKDTKPELVVRRLAFRLGYRFRLHRRDLPGCPDLVFPSRSKIILVHGCFWHRHGCNGGTRVPRTNRKFWKDKFAYNIGRDRRNIRQLRTLGWSVMVIWECQTTRRKEAVLLSRLVKFLDAD